MKKFLFILSLVIVITSGCSPQKRLSRLVERHPELISKMYGDTIIEIEIRKRNININYTDTIDFSYNSDTLFLSNMNFHSDLDTLILSSDSVAHARVFFDGSELTVIAWATISEKYIHKDSLKVEVKDSLIYRTIEKVVKIENPSAKNWRWLSFALIALVLIILIIRK